MRRTYKLDTTTPRRESEPAVAETLHIIDLFALLRGLVGGIIVSRRLRQQQHQTRVEPSYSVLQHRVRDWKERPFSTNYRAANLGESMQ